MIGMKWSSLSKELFFSDSVSIEITDNHRISFSPFDIKLSVGNTHEKTGQAIYSSYKIKTTPDMLGIDFVNGNLARPFNGS